MRAQLLTYCFCFVTLLIQAQTDKNTRGLGISLNSSFNSEVYPVRIIPSLTYFKNKSQFELGIGIHPLKLVDQKIRSVDFSYKYFPNQMDHKFDLYFVSQLSIIHNPRETFYPSTYNYLFLNGGYGFQINLSKKIDLGTNMTVGTFTNSKRSETPYPSFKRTDLFDEFGFNLAFQFNLSYRL